MDKNQAAAQIDSAYAVALPKLRALAASGIEVIFHDSPEGALIREEAIADLMHKENYTGDPARYETRKQIAARHRRVAEMPLTMTRNGQELWAELQKGDVEKFFCGALDDDDAIMRTLEEWFAPLGYEFTHGGDHHGKTISVRAL